MSQPFPQQVPPQLALALAAHAAAAQQQQAPAAAPRQDPVQLLRQMLQAAHTYMQVEPDEEDKAQFAKVLPLLQTLLAKDQQDKDALMGGSGNVQRALRKTV